ncbi:hypothetical protein ACOBQB_10250 [Streptomyces sp. G5(2025)]|uniref:hypothetical protein n=1 Tax=Streptomyces sp. G5(2025) TaxID=3406628 RepID=UPI003C26BCAA
MPSPIPGGPLMKVTEGREFLVSQSRWRLEEVVELDSPPILVLFLQVPFKAVESDNSREPSEGPSTL